MTTAPLFSFLAISRAIPFGYPVKFCSRGADFSLKNLMVNRGDCLSEAYQRYALSLSRQTFFGARVEYWPENLLVSRGLIFCSMKKFLKK